MNIVMLGHKRMPSREGGIEIVVEELATRMVAAGYQVTCLNRAGKHVCGDRYTDTKRNEYSGVQIKTVPALDIRGIAAVTASFFGAIIAAFGKYDVVHFHAEGPCVMLWLPKLLGKRCIATIHGLDYQRAKWGRFARKCILLGERCAAKFADEIIVLSRNAQQYFKDTYGRETVFIANGVNRPTIRKADLIDKKYGLIKDGYILFVGRLVPEKGIHYLIDAFKQIDIDKKLVIAGDTSDSDDYVRQLKLSAQGDNRILFLGFVQGTVLEELYSNAYIYVLPSDLEGMPLSLLEAMSYGNCCIVSDIPECVEVVEDKAVVFRKGNSQDLAKCLQMLHNENVNVLNMKNVASEFICNKYSWDDAAEKTRALYGVNN